MNETKVSSKGAVVIPAALRKKLGILPGKKVSVAEINGKIQIIPLSKDPVSALKGCMKGKKPAKQLIEEARRMDARRDAALESGRRKGNTR